MIVTSLFLLAASLERPFQLVPPTEQADEVKPAANSVCANLSKIQAKQARDSAGIANLPFAMGRRFATLDSYLAHLECLAQPVDLPWWKEVRPGVYRHMTTATNAPPNEVATRAELMRRFGFSR